MKIGNLTLLKLIGKGTMGEVYLSNKKDSKEFYATKKIDKKNADRPGVKKYFINEITILQTLKHNKIVRLIDLKQTPSHYYIVMEYCNGGSLLSCLRKYIEKYKKPFSEEIVQYLMRQVVRGLKYIHDHDIIHRDIKLDNVLVKFYAEEDLKNLNMMKTHIKISDFGISIKPGENKLAYTALGSPAYMDPFILKKLNERNDLLNSEGYDKSCDIWSLGAMCHEMLIGRRVFTGRNLKDLYKRVEGGNYSLPTSLSKEAISFLNGMLQYDSRKRLNIEEISRHHFLTRNTKDFSSIDFALVASKLGEDKLYINTKNNDTLWKIFNEETEENCRKIPTRILDTNTFIDNKGQEDEKETIEENKNQNSQSQVTDKYQPSQQLQTNNNYYSSTNTNTNTNANTNLNPNYYPQSQITNKEMSNNMQKGFREDKRIQNYNNFNSNPNPNNQIHFTNQTVNNINNFQNVTTNFNNMGTHDTFSPYPLGPSAGNTQNNNVPFYEGYTTNPQINNNINQQIYPNYPGDIKVKKQIATTDESCLNQ